MKKYLKPIITFCIGSVLLSLGITALTFLFESMSKPQPQFFTLFGATILLLLTTLVGVITISLIIKQIDETN
jgi:hypothetical protein